jgi:hypothetical protein
MRSTHNSYDDIALHKSRKAPIFKSSNGNEPNEYSGPGKSRPATDENAHPRQGDIEFGASALLLPAPSDLTDDTPPPSHQSYPTTPTGSPPPVGVLASGEQKSLRFLNHAEFNGNRIHSIADVSLYPFVHPPCAWTRAENRLRRSKNGSDATLRVEPRILARHLRMFKYPAIASQSRI